MGNNFSRIRGRSFAAALTISAALALGTLGAAPATAVEPNTGSITGTVTQNIGGAVTNAKNVSVSVHSIPDGVFVNGGSTDANGNYSVGSLLAGNYAVGFSQYGSSSSLTPEFYDNASDKADAKPVTVGAATTAGINAELIGKPIAPPVDRLAGADRFSTSAEISKATFTPGVSVAYIANGANFPDALSAAPVAGKDNAPVLLVSTDGIPAPVQTELERLKPGRIVVLGGVNAISSTVQTALKTLTTGEVTRAAGADRFATSAAISEAAFAPKVDVVYIANGYNFPDALSAAPVAGKNEAPVLLIAGDAVPTAIETELIRLQPGRIVVLGGVNAVSDKAQTALTKYTTGKVTRLSGPDRFDTSAAISKANFDAAVPVVYIANAYNFPDALSGAPVAGLNAAPVLLVPTDGIPTVIQEELKRLKPGSIVVLGGVNAISAAAEKQLSTYVVK